MDKHRWTKLLSDYQLDSNEQTFLKLTEAYSEKHRAYHTSRHIKECLVRLDNCPESIEYPRELEMAIWFHDAIYRPFSKTNEIDSANWAVEFLTLQSIDPHIVSRVQNYVLATTHNAVPESLDESVLVDIDLAILGANSTEYAAYESAIRFEYRVVPSFIYKRKRAELLRRFLDRQRIYQTEHYSDKFEDQARRNMQYAIERILR